MLQGDLLEAVVQFVAPPHTFSLTLLVFSCGAEPCPSSTLLGDSIDFPQPNTALTELAMG